MAVQWLVGRFERMKKPLMERRRYLAQDTFNVLH